MSSRRTGRTGLIVLALILAALALPKLVSWARTSDAMGTAEAPAAPQTVAEPTLVVDGYRVQPEALREALQTTGTLRPDEHVEVVSEIDGKVEEIRFAEGREVAAGDLLVRLDASELRARRRQAEQRVEIAALRQRRQQELLAEGVTSQQEYDFADSELAVLRSALALIDTQLQKTEIRAPFGGVVGLRAVSRGAYVTPSTRITTLQDLDPIKLDFSVPEKYAVDIAAGREVRFRVKGSDAVHRAVIYAVEPEVDLETRSLAVRARTANPGGRLRPGAFADVELVVRERPAALSVPAIAVISELGGKKVFVVEDGKARSRSVETGIRTDERVEITAGLRAGEVVLTSGLQRLRDDLAVRATLAPSETGP